MPTSFRDRFWSRSKAPFRFSRRSRRADRFAAAAAFLVFRASSAPVGLPRGTLPFPRPTGGNAAAREVAGVAASCRGRRDAAGAGAGAVVSVGLRRCRCCIRERPAPAEFSILGTTLLVTVQRSHTIITVCCPHARPMAPSQLLCCSNTCSPRYATKLGPPCASRHALRPAPRCANTTGCRERVMNGCRESRRRRRGAAPLGSLAHRSRAATRCVKRSPYWEISSDR